MQLSSANIEWRAVSFCPLNLCSHLPQWRHDSRHGAARKRFIAMQARGKLMSRKKTGDHTHGRPGVSTVQAFRRLLPALPAFNLKYAVLIPHHTAKLPQTTHGAGAVSARGKVLEASC